MDMLTTYRLIIPHDIQTDKQIEFREKDTSETFQQIRKSTI